MADTTYRLQFNPGKPFARQMNLGPVLTAEGASYHAGGSPSEHYYTTTDSALADRARTAGYNVTADCG